MTPEKEEDAGGFLARWSRRKREASRTRVGTASVPSPEALALPLADAPPLPGSEAPDDPAPAASPAAALPAGQPPGTDPEPLPPIESLTAASDLRPFLRPHVPAALRQAALRRMWSLDPVIRDFVGPADYAWDFNAPDGITGFALELGGDVAKLLAQAIGQVAEAGPEAPPEDVAEPASLPAAGDGPGPGFAPLADDPDGPATLAAAGDAPGPATDLPALLPEANAEASPALLPSPRRHGGALPA